ncbi:hypothetical protein FQR65_LT09089 [Abscondita terminalis]|nr:hypothetical protein FQR65_LT09089 [Abscondita terminalis]
MDKKSPYQNQQCFETSAINSISTNNKNGNSICDPIKIYLPHYISSVQRFVYPIHTVVERNQKTDQCGIPTIVDSESSEITLSVTNINKLSNRPTLIPRDHGSNCILEVSILEKHRQGCPNKKIEWESRNSDDDKVGSYDVINRIVYKTCTSKKEKNGEPALKTSAKSFKLNDPTCFGKNLKENRSRIEAIPILADTSNYSIARSPNLFERKPNETVSIYIRMDKNKQIPAEFQKMHYKGDSCKLHDPTERSKRLLALQKVIDETHSGAVASQCGKEFSPVGTDTRVFSSNASGTKSPRPIYSSPEIKNSINESLNVIEYKRVVFENKSQQTEFVSSILDDKIENEVLGHGMMINPPNRSSRWRTDPDAPINYNDNELFCGGFGIQWGVNAGKCGVCGDSYSDSRPRPNELGGYYGEGAIVAQYSSGSVIDVVIQLDQNHKGYFNFSLCDLEKSSVGEEEECFRAITLPDGSIKVPVTAEQGNGQFNYNLRLPTGLRSTHSVLRWQYYAGNSWGIDDDGTECLGCGKQEMYRTCTDIVIV